MYNTACIFIKLFLEADLNIKAGLCMAEMHIQGPSDSLCSLAYEKS